MVEARSRSLVRWLLIAVILLGVCAGLAWFWLGSSAVPPPGVLPQYSSWQPDEGSFENELWDQTVRGFVKDGLFDYRGLRSDAEAWAVFGEAIRRMGAIDPEQLPSDAHRFAFWLNAYNAFTIYGIFNQLDVREAEAVAAWRTNAGLGAFWRSYSYRIGRRLLTLDALENAVLRVQHPDARLHFAINCASQGCPPLLAEAFDPARLDNQLDDLCRAFFRNPTQFVAEVEAGRVLTSKILFEWYRTDFDSWEGGLQAFMARYVDAPELQMLLAREDLELVGLDYSWKLNIWPTPASGN